MSGTVRGRATQSLRMIAREGHFSLLFVTPVVIAGVVGRPERFGKVGSVATIGIRMIEIEAIAGPAMFFRIHDKRGLT